MNEPVLILTYYWPPSGGSGVQRWMYFCKFLPDNGFDPYVVTVDEKKASYKFIDESFNERVKHIPVVRTHTREMLKLYSRITTGSENEGIPQAFAGESKPGLLKKTARYIRGNYFIPDARKGWNKYAYKAAVELIKKHDIKKIITTGPPHSTHLVGLKLKRELGIKWIADFRDPWTEAFYNDMFYRTKRARDKDRQFEQQVIDEADWVLTVGPGMQKLLQQKSSDTNKISYVYNGFDEELFSRIKVEGFSEKEYIITHVGVLGEGQPIDSFLKALDFIHKDQPEITSRFKLKLVGKVSDVIVQRIKNICPWLSYELIGYVKQEEAIRHMMNSHLLFNSLAETPGSSYLISGKLMEYLASGRPVICLGDEGGDAALLMQKFPYCKVFSRSNINGIKNYMEELLSRFKQGNWCGHETENLEFTRKNTTRELAEIIEKV